MRGWVNIFCAMAVLAAVAGVSAVFAPFAAAADVSQGGMQYVAESDAALSDAVQDDAARSFSQDTAQDEMQTNALDSLQDLLAPYRAFQAELRRRDSSGELLVSHLWFRSPDKYRLELDDDTQIISDGKTRVLYEPDLEQATYEPASQSLESLPLLVFGAKKRELRDAYSIEMRRLEAGEVRFRLLGAESGEMVLELHFAGGRPVRLAWRDTLDNPVALDIEVVSTEAPDSGRFDFSQPEGVTSLHLGEPIGASE